MAWRRSGGSDLVDGVDVKNVRNVAVLGHFSHGKTTVMDNISLFAGQIKSDQIGKKKVCDTRQDEQNKGQSIKSCVASFRATCGDEKTGDDYCFNFLDNPGHVDFSPETSAALRICDGCLVVVDIVDGCAINTETQLKLAFQERVMPGVFVNKIDRHMNELQSSASDIFWACTQAVSGVNTCCEGLIEEYKETGEEPWGSYCVDPVAGQMAIGSASDGWGFTLTQFANWYSTKFGMAPAKLAKKLWAENAYYDKKNSKWARKGKGLTEGFVQFILEPIFAIKAVCEKGAGGLKGTLPALGITLDAKEQKLTGAPLFATVMMKWLPLANAIFDVCRALPSPVEAMPLRAPVFYPGPTDSKVYNSICKVDAQAELVFYISNQFYNTNSGRFVAYGRVYAGTITNSINMKILPAGYDPTSGKEVVEKSAQRVLALCHSQQEGIQKVPAGFICGLVGIDNDVVKNATLTTSKECYPFKDLRFCVTPVVKVAVAPKSTKDLRKLVDGLKRLVKADPLVITEFTETGEHVVGGAGEQHLGVLLEDLQQKFMKGIEFNVGDPIVSYTETITCRTGNGPHKFPETVLSKSPNKHNRLWVIAEPLGEELCQAVEKGDINPDQDMKKRARVLVDKYGWEMNDARRIWSFGCPPNCLGSILVDKTKGVQYLLDIKQLVNSGFTQVTSQGVLCREKFRSGKFYLTDASLHADNVHRGGGQVIPAARRVFSAACLSGGPGIQEPMFEVNIACPREHSKAANLAVQERDGKVIEVLDKMGTNIQLMKCWVPVRKAQGFTGKLRGATQGTAFSAIAFSHWQIIKDDPLTEGSDSNKIIMAVRERKGLKMEIPNFKDFYDKL